MSDSEDRLVAQYLPLVRRLALQMAARLPANVELDDLTQAGLMGLLDAVRRYQQTPDAKFETYATTRIRGAMLDELRTQDWLPRSVRTKARAIEHAISSLHQRLMRSPNEAEIAEEMGLSLGEYQQQLEDAQGMQVVHYEDFSYRQSEPGQAFADTHADESGLATPFHHMVSQVLRTALVDAIKQLPEREQVLLSLLFEQDLTQKEIAQVLEVTEGRVSQIRSQAVARIRAALAQSGWQGKPEETDYHMLF